LCAILRTGRRRDDTDLHRLLARRLIDEVLSERELLAGGSSPAYSSEFAPYADPASGGPTPGILSTSS